MNEEIELIKERLDNFLKQKKIVEANDEYRLLLTKIYQLDQEQRNLFYSQHGQWFNDYSNRCSVLGLLDFKINTNESLDQKDYDNIYELSNSEAFRQTIINNLDLYDAIVNAAKNNTTFAAQVLSSDLILILKSEDLYYLIESNKTNFLYCCQRLSAADVTEEILEKLIQIADNFDFTADELQLLVDIYEQINPLPNPVDEKYFKEKLASNNILNNRDLAYIYLHRDEPGLVKYIAKYDAFREAMVNVATTKTGFGAAILRSAIIIYLDDSQLKLLLKVDKEKLQKLLEDKKYDQALTNVELRIANIEVGKKHLKPDDYEADLALLKDFALKIKAAQLKTKILAVPNEILNLYQQQPVDKDKINQTYQQLNAEVREFLKQPISPEITHEIERSYDATYKLINFAFTTLIANEYDSTVNKFKEKIAAQEAFTPEDLDKIYQLRTSEPFLRILESDQELRHAIVNAANANGNGAFAEKLFMSRLINVLKSDDLRMLIEHHPSNLLYYCDRLKIGLPQNAVVLDHDYLEKIADKYAEAGLFSLKELVDSYDAIETLPSPADYFAANIGDKNLLSNRDLAMVYKHLTDDSFANYIRDNKAFREAMVRTGLVNPQFAKMILNSKIINVLDKSELEIFLKTDKDEFVKYCHLWQVNALPENIRLAPEVLKQIREGYNKNNKLTRDDNKYLGDLLDRKTLLKVLGELGGKINLQENLRLLAKYKVEALSRGDQSVLNQINQFLNKSENANIKNAFNVSIIQSAKSEVKVEQETLPAITNPNIIAVLKPNGMLLGQAAIDEVSKIYASNSEINYIEKDGYLTFRFPGTYTPYVIYNETIGQGGFGTVNLMQNLRTGEWSIIKFQTIRAGAEEYDRGIALREHETLKELGVNEGFKPLTIKPGEMGNGNPQQKQIAVGMNLAKGQNLHDVIYNSGQKPTYLKACRLSANILLAYEKQVKNKYVHRDLKPQNIMCHRGSEETRIIDFGAAGRLPENDNKIVMPVDADPITTFWYAAPELNQPPAVYSEKTDVYALGIILMELYGIGIYINHEKGFRLPSISDPEPMGCFPTRELRNMAIAFISKMIGPVENRPDIAACKEFITHISLLNIADLEKFKKIAIVDIQDYLDAKDAGKKQQFVDALKNADEVWFVDSSDKDLVKRRLEVISELHEAGVNADNKLFTYDPKDGATPLQRIESIKAKVERQDPSQIRSYFYVADDIKAKNSEQFRAKQIHVASVSAGNLAQQFKLDDKIDRVKDDDLRSVTQDLLQMKIVLNLSYAKAKSIDQDIVEDYKQAIKYIDKTLSELHRSQGQGVLTVHGLKTQLNTLQTKLENLQQPLISEKLDDQAILKDHPHAAGAA